MVEVRLGIENKDLKDRIISLKRRLGDELVILTHHYQRQEIVDLGDFRGDSLALARIASQQEGVRFIVFCGVHFMAESAAIMARSGQTVQIPEMEAGCWMADMADPFAVERAWRDLISVTGPEEIIPVLYINSEAELKAFCGREGGLVCTSSNAGQALEWGLRQDKKIFFLPDQHLGRNTGHRLGISPDKIILWEPGKPLGGRTEEEIKRSQLILWDGYCLVHTRFNIDQITENRKQYPGAKIVVHPECTPEVVEMADAVGSTSFIVSYVQDAPADATIIVGTEINMVKRLALENPDKKVLELHPSLCPNMYKTDLNSLLCVLERIGQVNIVTVPEDIKQEAKLALDRMLALGPATSKNRSAGDLVFEYRM